MTDFTICVCSPRQPMLLSLPNLGRMRLSGSSPTSYSTDPTTSGEFVGDLAGVASLEGATGHSFKITMGETPSSLGPAAGLIVVFMQFWAHLGSPPHLVVVGRPLIDMRAHFQDRA
ncbi:hypothetical protein SPHINGO8AM_230023 [Sphingomonas sp. 8AM]|nr:hypothetical protein SPHINGO8AM_230023 [Sphingomonas sp. 8AM]